jgi:hypothetical protein
VNLQAAVADALVKKGDASKIPETVRLYREATSHLEAAMLSPKYNEKVPPRRGSTLQASG